MNHISEEQLALYAGGDLARSEADAVAQHLRSCACCETRLAEFRESGAVLESAFGEPSEEDLFEVRERVVNRLHKRKQAVHLWRWSTAAAAAAIVTAVLLFHPKQPQQETPNPAPVTTAYLQVHYEPLAQISMPNLNTQFRPARSRHSHPAPGLRSVTLIAERDGPPILKMTTSDPNVVIFWQLNERTRTRD